MTKFRLKKEARQFFPELTDLIKTLEFWEKKTIPIELLDKVEDVYISYGQKSDDSTTDLRSWTNIGNEKHASLFFTLNVNDISHNDFLEIQIPERMGALQHAANMFLKSGIINH